MGLQANRWLSAPDQSYPTLVGDEQNSDLHACSARLHFFGEGFMSKLALLGGQPVFEQTLDHRSFWPPVDESTAKKLQDLYYSRQWTAFGDAEPAFAQAFAAHHGARYGIFAINGTVTLQCALGAYGIGAGDEVIIPPLTWYATAMAVRHVGALPVFVDIKPDTLCIDPDKIASAITKRTKAIIPVHAYGSMADMDSIMAIAQRHGFRVIEDCAHMHGGIWDGKGVGSIGDVGSFSFQQGKTMASGEGGICITNDPEIADRIFRIKQIGYGIGEQPREAKTGPPRGLLCYNFRATAFQAVILHEQLRSLDDRLERYRKGMRYLEERLNKSTKIRFQTRERKTDRQGYFGWVMIFDDPTYADIPVDVLQKAMRAEGLPLFRAEGPIYRFILFNLEPEAYRIDQACSVTEHACLRILWGSHAYLGLDENQIEKMADTIEKVMSNVDELRRYASDL
jgi:L-glutamine:2-deoxy-scyllo-inosose/3-amino-2,3-dideoxy-scyllo-inosose aminotransferase